MLEYLLMEIKQSEQEFFFQKIKKCNDQPLLQQDATFLVKQIADFAGKFHFRQVRLGLANESDEQTLLPMIRLAYGWRYGGGSQLNISQFPALCNGTNQQILVAKLQGSGNQELILATCCLARAPSMSALSELELVRFYRFTNGSSWQQYFMKQQCEHVYELKRFAFHPLFELGQYHNLQKKITLSLRELILHLLEPSSWVGLTARANVKKFLLKAGWQLVPIEDLALQQSAEINFLIKLLPRYFQNFYAYRLR